MDSEGRGRENGRGHGHCRGRGPGVREASMSNAPVIACGPTAPGIRSSSVTILRELGSAQSDVGVSLPFPDKSTTIGGRGRGRMMQVKVAAVSTEVSGKDEGVLEPLASASSDAEVAERDRGASVQSRIAAGGRGRGIRIPLPNISTETCDPADEEFQAAVVGAPIEIGGRAGRGSGIQQVPSSSPTITSASGQEGHVERTSTLDHSEPTPESGVEKEENTFKAVEKGMETLQGMFDYKFKSTKKGKSDKHIMCENWACAKGINRSVMVVSMNEYVNSGDTYIPGEIVITPFTLRYGIDLMYTYWTRVDPGNNIPIEHEVEAGNNVTNFDLPKPGTPDEKWFKGYKRIAGEIEMFVKKNSYPAFFGPKDESGDVYFLFCKKEMVDCYTKGMNWLFALGGKGKFPFKLLPLESVLVALSLGGLEHEAARKGSVLDCFQQVVECFNDAVNSVVDTTAASTEELMQTAHDMLSKFTGSRDPRKYIQRFMSLGGKSKRLALRRLLQHPHAFLGAFIEEDQATQYLDTPDYLNDKYLACAYHQGSDKMRGCAQLQAARMIYFALDVVLVNYGDGNHGIRPREGKHYPFNRDY